MPSQTRQRLIETAKRRFYRDGFRNVGIDAILTDVGISKAAFYKHFESKDELMVAVLSNVDEFLQNQFRQMVRERGGPSGEGQLRAVLEVVQQVMAEPDFHGCIFVNAAIEFPLQTEPAHEAAARHKRWLEDFFFELAERAAAPDPAGLAKELGMVIEGAYVTRAVTGDSGTIETARRLVDQIISNHLTDARPGRRIPARPSVGKRQGPARAVR
jgi:AcrR family transcriptional regulator